MIKFVKSADKIPVFVYGSGYGYIIRDGEENSDTFVTVMNGVESVTLSASDVPALIEALESAVKEAVTLAEKDLAKYRNRAESK